jgi:hypothetical protein
MPSLNDVEGGDWGLGFCVAVFGDDDPLGQPITQDICGCGGHWHGGLAPADDEHALVATQVIAAASDEESIPFTPDVPPHGG